MATPQHKNPCLRGHVIYNLSKPFFGHHHYTLSMYMYQPYFLRNTSRAMKFTISRFLTL